ncbi:MAG: hydrogenase iron-sulfur subunit [Candidatus Omnitrophica bacterium]|nr:hydrogenase iron-sulfur subunit [Candidatus Omnitrophota bacterium]
MSEFEPKIVTFLCNWCSYEGADKAGNARLESPANILPIKVMCSGRVEPQFILEAFKKGADGVLILGCHPGDCHYKEGNYKTLRRQIVMEQFLEQVFINPKRVRLDWVSAGEAERYKEITTSMTETVKQLGPFCPEELKQKVSM